jgi:N-glycosidase YbiA
MSDVITFFCISAPYGCFTSFAPYPMEIDGQFWPTIEHYPF